MYVHSSVSSSRFSWPFWALCIFMQNLESACESAKSLWNFLLGLHGILRSASGKLIILYSIISKSSSQQRWHILPFCELFLSTIFQCRGIAHLLLALFLVFWVFMDAVMLLVFKFHFLIVF